MSVLTMDAIVRNDTAPDGDDDLWEQLGETRVEKPAMGMRELYLANELCWVINSFSRPRDLGLAFTEMLFLLTLSTGETRKRRPDVALVSSARVGQPVLSEDEAWEITPDLAVEIISPSNRATDVEIKIREYLDAGVRTVWVIHPMPRTLYVHRAQGVEFVAPSGVIKGGEVLPGLSIPMSELFASLGVPPIPIVSDE